MDTEAIRQLLSEHDPAPFRVIEDDASSPYFFTCDHAGRTLPRALGTLGLSETALQRHIAWDIGAAGVTERLATSLGAFSILQTYSRLVIDCNRPPGAPSSIAKHSEDTTIPGNQTVSAEDAERRAREIFYPYHRRIQSELEGRRASGRRTIYVAVHSFTPRYLGVDRPWHLGVLYGRDAGFARLVLELLRRESAWVVGENEPYSVSDESDYGVVQHGERRGLPHVELEIRQDLITDALGQATWAEHLARVFREAAAHYPG